jgi:hypothetical protein
MSITDKGEDMRVKRVMQYQLTKGMTYARLQDKVVNVYIHASRYKLFVRAFYRFMYKATGNKKWFSKLGNLHKKLYAEAYKDQYVKFLGNMSHNAVKISNL